MALHADSPIAILGMHRSGTSCLAGSLQIAGLYLGHVNEDAPHNAKGNRENRIIMDFHEELLETNGGSWDAPPADLRWSERDRLRLTEIIASYPDDVVWGFKDPRTLVTLQGWLSAIPELRFVGTFRHPTAVARSLEARNGFSIDFSIDLWRTYNELLLSYQQRFGFDLVNYDVSEQEYQDRVSRAALNLRLMGDSSDTRFFENSLRHGMADTSFPLPKSVASVYARLLERTT